MRYCEHYEGGDGRTAKAGRICFFLRDLGSGGAERVTVDVASYLAELGVPVDLVVARYEGLYVSRVGNRVRLVDLRAGRLAVALPKLSVYLRREQPAALFSALPHTNVIAVAARWLSGGVPTRTIVSVRNHWTRSLQAATGVVDRFVMPWLVRFAYRRADGVVCVSHGVAQDVFERLGIPESKIHTIYNPVRFHQIIQQQREPLDDPWFADDAVPVILAVGRLVEQKDYPTLIRAFEQVRRKIKARLVIIGEGKDRPAIERMVRELGLERDVALRGVVENPHAYMARCRVFVLSSVREGFGNVLVEALAAGATIVSTDCQSGPSEILAQGRYGRLVEVGDVAGMAEAILDAIRNPDDPDTLRKRAAEFDMEIIAPQYLKVLLP